MDPEDIKLESVNWQHGMLLTPDHFLRQERYYDSALLWLTRYGSASFGLVGGGPRLPESEQGAVKHDPVVSIAEDEETLGVAVTQCRGITPGGVLVDVDPSHPVRKNFSKKDLEGVSEATVYLIAYPQEKDAADGPADEANPQMQPIRRPAYGIALEARADDLNYALPLVRIGRPASGVAFEKSATYIPPCATLTAHSELAAGWRTLVERAETLFRRYSALYRAMQEYLGLFRERGIETELDIETMHFVGRMTAGLQDALYSMLDPAQPAEHLFAALRKFFHTAAVYMDLSAPVEQYYSQLIETGETELVSLLEQQKKLLEIRRRWSVNDDLRTELDEALARLGALDRLELALEGKYVDFRISPALEAMNFLFDRGGKALYKIAAKHSRLQGFEDELTIHFANLRLEGRDRYRLILTTEDNAVFDENHRVPVEIRLNEGAGYRREPIHLTCERASGRQRNFEFDFEAPDVPTITDLKVSVPKDQPIRAALLFTRHRFYAGGGQSSAPPPPPPPSRFERESSPAVTRPRGERSSRVAPSRFSRVEPADAPPTSPPQDAPPPPWEQQGGAADAPPADDPPPKPRRRRRLE